MPPFRWEGLSTWVSMFRCDSVETLSLLCRLSAIVLVTLGWPASVTANAQSDAPARPLSAVDAMAAAELHLQARIADPSPDGTLIAFVICDPRRRVVDPDRGYSGNQTPGAAFRSRGCSVHVSDLTAGTARPVSSDGGNEWGPSWSPDGGKLAFFSDAGGVPQLWVWDRDADAVRRVHDEAAFTRWGFDVPLWLPDSRRIVVKLRERRLEEPRTVAEQRTDGASVRVLVSGRQHPQDASRSDTLLSAPPALSHAFVSDLAIIDVTTGSAQRITSGRQPLGVRISPSGRRLAFMNHTGRVRESPSRHIYDLMVIDLQTRTSRRLSQQVVQEFGFSLSWSPDERHIAFVSGSAENNVERGADLFVSNIATGEVSRLRGAPPRTFGAAYLAPLWADDSDHIFVTGADSVWKADVRTMTVASILGIPGASSPEVVRTANEQLAWSPAGASSILVAFNRSDAAGSKLVKLNIHSGNHELVHEDAVHIGRLFATGVGSPDGRSVILAMESAVDPQDIWMIDVSSRERRRITRIDPALGTYSFGRPCILEYASTDGVPLRGAVLLPTGYQPGTSYPLVVWVYGGNFGSRQAARFGLTGYSEFNLHMLTTRGYAVLWPDAPLSSGNPMEELPKSVMPAVQRLVELGIADGTRVAVMGHSFGGYSALALGVQSPRFRAVVVNAGFADVTSMYGTMSPDGRGLFIPFFEEHSSGMGAPPWAAPQRYLQNSPIYFLDRLRAPVMIQVGGLDPASRQADQLFVALKRLEKNAIYLSYRGEDHTMTGLANLTDYWERLTEFLSIHLDKAVSQAQSEIDAELSAPAEKFRLDDPCST